jgi:3-phosphoshikimate 1-carboxyvinyltransferase
MSFNTQKMLAIQNLTRQIWGEVKLPLSKSESNRLLIIQALSKGSVNDENLSEARDTRLLHTALVSEDQEINIQDAGTAMRFLTAYYCATGQHKVLTGSARMCERPIGILVEALREIGFDIKYLKKEGYPPLEITPSDISAIKNEVHIAGNISSQYISALLMIAPVLPHGLAVYFTTDISSRPYIDMTLDLLSRGGITYEWAGSHIYIANQKFKEATLSPSADWSAAGYWFSMAALADKSEFKLKGLTFDTTQGDKVIAKWCEIFGVNRRQEPDGLVIYSDHTTHLKNPITPNHPENSSPLFDFTDYPDLAQTMIVLFAASNVNATFTGLQSLRIKETDRIAALQNELLKFGVKLHEIGDGIFGLDGTFSRSHQIIETYDDHRMAMAFAPLALLGSITIENPGTVEKSYPDFWDEMQNVGFQIN